MLVITKENSPILINNDEHKNFVETDKIVPKGTVLDGNFINIKGLRRGKEFMYRLFIDNDGIIMYEKNVKPMMNKSNFDGEVRVINMPSVKSRTFTTALISAGAGVIAFAVAKRMQTTNKRAFMIAGVTALLGYGLATYMRNNDPIVYQKN
jgi:hypothetical protein